MESKEPRTNAPGVLKILPDGRYAFEMYLERLGKAAASLGAVATILGVVWTIFFLWSLPRGLADLAGVSVASLVPFVALTAALVLSLLVFGMGAAGVIGAIGRKNNLALPLQTDVRILYIGLFVVLALASIFDIPPAFRAWHLLVAIVFVIFLWMIQALSQHSSTLGSYFVLALIVLVVFAIASSVTFAIASAIVRENQFKSAWEGPLFSALLFGVALGSYAVLKGKH